MMKKSLACTVLAGLLAGCVMTGAEAADPIDIVINQDGSVTPSTYSGEKYRGVHMNGGTTDLGNNVRSICTNGKVDTDYLGYDYGVNGLYVVNSGTIKGSGIEEINIKSENSNSYGINTANGSNSVQLHNLGKIITEGYSSTGVSLFSESGNTNVITFSNDGDSGSIVVNATGTEVAKGCSAGGLSLIGGKNYIGTYIDGEGNEVTGKELKCIDVNAVDGGIDGIFAGSVSTIDHVTLGADGEYVIAFSGKNSYIRACSVRNGVDGIHVGSGKSFKLSGIGYIDVEGSSAAGIVIDGNENVEICFDAPFDKDTIKVKSDYSTGISINSTAGNVNLIGIRNIVVDGVDSGGIGIYGGVNNISFDGDSSIEAHGSGENCRITGIYIDDGNTTVTDLKNIVLRGGGKDGFVYGLDLWGGTNYIGTYLDGEGNKVTGKELHSIDIDTQYEVVDGLTTYGINIDGNGKCVIAFDGSSSFIRASGDSVYGIYVDGEHEFEISGIGRIDVSSRALDEYDGAIGVSIYSAKNGEIAFSASDSEPTIKVVSDNYATGIMLGSDDSVTTKLTGIKSIVVNSTSTDSGVVAATGIMLSGGLNEISFTDGSSVEVVSQNSYAAGIVVIGGNTTITGLRNISVSDRDPVSGAIYVGGGELNIGGDDSTDLLAINGHVDIDGGTLKLKNAVVMGNVTEDTYYTGNQSQLVLDKKIIVNGNVTVENEIKADDADDDFTFGKTDNTSSIWLKGGLNVSAADAKVKIYASQITMKDNGIKNSGTLVINPDAVPRHYYIYGDVYHNRATRTEINLVGTNNNEGKAVLSGRVYGSDNNFKMKLDRAEWLMDNVANRSASVNFGTIHNVSLEHNASISININTNIYLDYSLDVSPRYVSTIGWWGNYHMATFCNLQNDGTGAIDLAVDLERNVGDLIVLEGTTPEKLKINLYNSGDNNGNPFVPDGEHSVTYAKAPIGSNVTIDTSLTPLYGTNAMIYTPIVETGENSDGRYWNFVGWNQSTGVEDRKSTAKDALDVPNMMPEMEEKRLEEIHRYAVHKDLSELGAWVRGETGKMSADGVDFDVKVISGGYDWANKTSKGNFFMGIGVGHGTSNADMNFVGDSKNTSFSVYGSWYGRKNYDYIDFVAKYGKIDHEYNGTNFDGVPCEGKYDKKMYSLFLKYGRRIPLKNGFYVEPFGSVTYGRINDADFYDKGQDARMHVNAILSKIVSAGVMFGKSVKGTELYCKLAYSYDFDGEVSGSAPDLNYSEKTDMGGSSYKFAIGASRNLGKQNSLHLDLEKDFGGKMKRPWNLSLTFKHTW